MVYSSLNIWWYIHRVEYSSVINIMLLKMFTEIRTGSWYKKAGYKVYRLHNIFYTHAPKIFSKVSMMIILKLEDMGYYIFFVLLVCIIYSFLCY